MPAITYVTEREMMEKSAGKKLFEYIERQNFNGMDQMLSKSQIGLEHLDDFSNTPFLFACYLGRYPFVKYLAECGANILRINVLGQNALALATYSGDQKTCEFLLGRVPFDNYNSTSICSPMCVAVITENIDLVKYFMQFERDGIMAKFQCQSGSIHGVCPLKLAMMQKHKQIIELLRPIHDRHFIH